MPTFCHSRRAWHLLPAALLCLAFTARAAQTAAPSPGRAPAATNAAPAAPQLPKSVFVDPTETSTDPFFPLSKRFHKVPVVPATASAVPAVLVDLQLKGISGGANHRLAIINNRTFEAGEDGDVNSTTGLAHIKCKEITEDSVRVVVNGQERTLRLRSGS